MGKLSNFIKSKKLQAENIYKNYLITLISGAIASILGMILLESERSYEFNDTLGKVILGFVIFTFGEIFIETIARKLVVKLILSIINAGVSVLWVFLITTESLTENNYYVMYMLLSFGLYVLLFGGITLFVVVKRSRLTMQEYYTRFLRNTIVMSIVVNVISTGVLFILYIFSTLIIKLEVFDLFMDAEILMLGFVHLPVFLTILTDNKKETSKVFKGVAWYVLMPIQIIATLIIYAYILKIFSLSELPKNQVYAICAGVVTSGILINFLAYSYLPQGKLNIYGKLIKFYKYFLIPMIPLEIQAMNIRISNYGVTENRYLGVVFIIVQIIYLTWELWVLLGSLIAGIFKKKPESVEYGKSTSEFVENDASTPETMENDAARKMGIFGSHYEMFIFVIIGIYIVIAFMPGIRIHRFIYSSNVKRLNEAIKEEDYIKAEACIDVLQGNVYGDEYLNDNFTDEEIDDIQTKAWGIIREREEQDDTGAQYIYHYIYVDELDVKDYSKLTYVSGGDNIYGESKNVLPKDVELDMYKYQGPVNQENIVCKLKNLEDIIELAIEDSEKNQDPDEDKYVITVDKNSKFVIQKIEFFKYENGRISDLIMEGYLLEK